MSFKTICADIPCFHFHWIEFPELPGVTSLGTHRRASRSVQSSRPGLAAPVSASPSPWPPLTSAEIRNIRILTVCPENPVSCVRCRGWWGLTVFLRVGFSYFGISKKKKNDGFDGSYWQFLHNIPLGTLYAHDVHNKTKQKFCALV